MGKPSSGVGNNYGSMGIIEFCPLGQTGNRTGLQFLVLKGPSEIAQLIPENVSDTVLQLYLTPP